jgi:hypothetical protein
MDHCVVVVPARAAAYRPAGRRSKTETRPVGSPHGQQVTLGAPPVVMSTERLLTARPCPVAFSTASVRIHAVAAVAPPPARFLGPQRPGATSENPPERRPGVGAAGLQVLDVEADRPRRRDHDTDERVPVSCRDLDRSAIRGRGTHDVRPGAVGATSDGRGLERGTSRAIATSRRVRQADPRLSRRSPSHV